MEPLLPPDGVQKRRQAEPRRELNRLFFMVPVSTLEDVCLYSLSGKQSHKVPIFLIPHNLNSTRSLNSAAL
jgi:hypothetical protein